MLDSSMPLDRNIGFVIGRHVASPSHVNLCFRAYTSVRKFYPNNTILIVDDNSTLPDPNVYDDRTIVIQSAIRGAGEFGIYYYYYITRPFDRGVLLHDSMVINKPLDLPDVPIIYLWHFPFHASLEQVAADVEMLLGELDNKADAEQKYRSHSWFGMFGCGSVVTWDHLHRVASCYQLFRLLPKVNTRLKRCAMERVLGVLFNGALDKERPSLNGNILDLPGAWVRKNPLIGYGGAMDKTWHGR